MEGEAPTARPLRDAVLLLGQVNALVRSMEMRDAWTGADNLAEQVRSLREEAKRQFQPDEVERFVPKVSIPNRHPMSLQAGFPGVRSCAIRLQAYLRDRMGSPAAEMLLHESLVEAKRAAERNHPICGAIMARVALEQGLRELCQLRNVEARTGAMAGEMNQALWKAEVYPQHKWREIQSKLDLFQEPAHGKPGPPMNELLEAIQWTDRCLEAFLTGVPPGG